MECLEDNEQTETKYNALVRKNAEECREQIRRNPTKPPCQREDIEKPTQYTFCKLNLITQYKSSAVPKKDDKVPAKPCTTCVKKATPPGPTKEERLAAAIECIAQPLPKWFTEPKFKSPSPPGQCPCTRDSTNESKNSKGDKFSVNYPANRLTTNLEIHDNPNCHPNIRCTGTPPPFDEHKFVPDYRNMPLTEKFYSRYERLDNVKLPCAHHEEEIQKIWDFFPRNYYCVPRYTNQMYGWWKADRLQKLEFCDKSQNFIPNIIKNIKVENKRYGPEATNYCYCAENIKNADHWKIV